MSEGTMRAAGVILIICVSVTAMTAAVRAGTPLKIVASIFPISSISAEIGGDKVEVITLVPSGADPHHFDLTPTDARALNDADAVFMIGGHFDGWLAAGSVAETGPCLVIELYKAFEDSLIRVGDDFNPHFWLDPLIGKSIGEIIAMALSTMDLSDREYFSRRLAAFGARCDSLNAAARVRLGRAGFKEFVSVHPAWTYFARRYGLKEAGVLEVTAEQEPSARHIAQVIRVMSETPVKFILTEEFSNPVLAKGVASETGARIITLDPLGGADRPGRSTYFQLLDYNVSMIERGSMPAGRK
jgi:zinc transport system substrate-binding protein